MNRVWDLCVLQRLLPKVSFTWFSSSFLLSPKTHTKAILRWDWLQSTPGPEQQPTGEDTKLEFGNETDLKC